MSNDIEGEVLGLSSEGFGIIRQDHLVVFVPFTAPGDKILYRITQQKKNYAQGQLVEILQPGSDRIKPLCPYFGTCGGCQLQHVNYETQLKAKFQNVQETLKRIGKFADLAIRPIVPAEKFWAYRRHVTLRIHPQDDHLSAGYFTLDNQSIIDIKLCPIFIHEDDQAIQEVQQLLKGLTSKNFSDGYAVLFKTEQQKMILSLSFDQPLSRSYTFEDFLYQNPRWIGLLLEDGKNKRSWGTVTSLLHVDRMRFICSPQVFTQNHPEQSNKIYKKIVEIASNLPGEEVLDLYCGIGISSLLLAKQGHSVTGIEYSPDSIAFAEENARLNAISNIHFIQGDVEKCLKKTIKKKAGIILINPPRQGLTPQVIEEILKRHPKEIIYISCMPSTLARDLHLLCKKDYKIAFAEPYDMFPQTRHVETLVHLKSLIH